MSNGTVQVEDGELYWEQHGSGADVVLLNSGWMDLRMWEQNAAALVSHGLRVTRYDGRGVGRRSSTPDRPWDDVADLMAVLGAAGVRRPVLLGVSDGGRLALDAAAEYPERVRALIIGGTAIADLPDASEEESAALRALVAALAPRQEAADGGDLRAAFAADLAVWAPTLDAAARERMIEICLDSGNPFAPDRMWPQSAVAPGIGRLGEITAPTLVLVGEHDVPLSRMTARRIAGAVRGARLTVVAGADHLLYAGAAEQFNRLVGEFCTRLGPDRPE